MTSQWVWMLQKVNTHSLSLCVYAIHNIYSIISLCFLSVQKAWQNSFTNCECIRLPKRLLQYAYKSEIVALETGMFSVRDFFNSHRTQRSNQYSIHLSAGNVSQFVRSLQIDDWNIANNNNKNNNNIDRPLDPRQFWITIDRERKNHV